MIDRGVGFGALAFRLLIALVAMCGCVRPASADTLRIGEPLCYAVTPLANPDQSLPARYSCDGRPRDYEDASLWLRWNLQAAAVPSRDLVLMVHQSRFDRLAVAFSYADGEVVWQQVATGDFRDHWRVGGQAAFEAPVREAPLVATTLRFDRAASADLLRIRSVTRAEAGVQSATLAALIGAALTLLLAGAIYNASLALAVRRQYLFWHAGWAATMVAWGAIWSQIELVAFPDMAGSTAAQTCTLLACLAITAATLSAVTSFARHALPRWFTRSVAALGIAIGVYGIPVALVRSAAIGAMGAALGLMVLLDLAAVAAMLVWGWRRGSGEARDLAAAWMVPMAALALTQLVDVGTMLWGGGAQVLVLFAAAWQTVWLSIASTRRLAGLRIERDAARAAEAAASALAGRDPLTGLRNRRGFTERLAPWFGNREGALALLLIDIDRFKAINDAFGHEIGDQVLERIARRLERWESDGCAVARLGGEEFALMIQGLDGFALTRFADGVRQELAACDHAGAIGDQRVTVSIGVVVTADAADFQTLYRNADAALYDAKQAGRNRVVLYPQAGKVDGPATIASDTIVSYLSA